MSTFVHGVDLSRAFYNDIVGPLVAPWPHSAAFVGYGSDVLGYDTERSTDHGWGPRMTVFVEPADVGAARKAVNDNLPDTFAGCAVRYGWDDYPVVHHVEVTTLPRWLEDVLGFDPRVRMSTLDWLVTPQQLLLEVVRGAVHHDGLGELGPLRAALAAFPDEVRMWMLACQWRRIDQEDAFVGRAAEVGDELGSQIVAARLVRELMRLHFLYAGEYWPYTKWFGTAYAELPGAGVLLPTLREAVAATDFASREAALVTAYEAFARLHNESAVAEPLDPHVRPFYGRPWRVLFAGRFVDACRGRVDDPWLRSLPLTGSIDQIVDCTDVLSVAEIAARLRAVYGEPAEP